MIFFHFFQNGIFSKVLTEQDVFIGRQFSWQQKNVFDIWNDRWWRQSWTKTGFGKINETKAFFESDHFIFWFWQSCRFVGGFWTEMRDRENIFGTRPAQLFFIWSFKFRNLFFTSLLYSLSKYFLPLNCIFRSFHWNVFDWKYQNNSVSEIQEKLVEWFCLTRCLTRDWLNVALEPSAKDFLSLTHTLSHSFSPSLSHYCALTLSHTLSLSLLRSR